ncbi:dihydroorotase, homodimeric type [Phytophthora cinnamomi]|uniref:dihydroorotase, homodimeric type n=1 Tax=Phytophthora cinnamomi TaxID=4785 RepID=UPI003559B5EA|nr:dihydroorotase, homodimeric type [Phytophthora cinnamomi]
MLNVTLVRSESHATSQFACCIVVPNLVPPVTTTERALAYHERVLVHVPEECRDPSGAKGFEPLVMIYMTDGDDLYDGRYHRRRDPPRCRHDQDLYRQALPCWSDDQHVTKIDNLYLIKPLVAKFPQFKVAMEHITTEEVAELVPNAPAKVATAITPQHLLYNRIANFHGGLRPHK